MKGTIQSSKPTWRLGQRGAEILWSSSLCWGFPSLSLLSGNPLLSWAFVHSLAKNSRGLAEIKDHFVLVMWVSIKTFIPAKRLQEPLENLSRRCRNRWCVRLPWALKSVPGSVGPVAGHGSLEVSTTICVIRWMFLREWSEGVKWLPSECVNGRNEPSWLRREREWRGNQWTIRLWTEKSEWWPLRLAPLFKKKLTYASLYFGN